MNFTARYPEFETDAETLARFASAAKELSMQRDRLRDAKIRSCIRAVIGEPFPSDPCDVLQVLNGRGMEGTIFVMPNGASTFQIRRRDEIVRSVQLT